MLIYTFMSVRVISCALTSSLVVTRAFWIPFITSDVIPKRSDENGPAQLHPPVRVKICWQVGYCVIIVLSIDNIYIHNIVICRN